ncbi:hypothetical protein GW17_00014331, partial [Ensete ventricosum]
GELLGEHKGVKVDGRKRQGSDNKLKGAQLPKAKRRLEWRWTRRSATMPQR